MTTTKNNEHKKLNFSSEREQNQACLNSAEHEKNQGRKVLNVPNLRFKEFQGEWEKCKLGDLCNVLMCKRILASQTNTEEGVPFYKIGTIGNAPDAYISKELFDDYKTKYNYPHKGEVMITCAGTVGKCVIYDGKDAYYQDSNIVWIDNPSQCISNSFLYHLLAIVDWRKLNSTTIIRIYNDDLRNLKLSYPQIEEQQKISRLLSLLDERIATQNKIIEDLKKLKSAIVEKVFCSPNQEYPMCRIEGFEQALSTYKMSDFSSRIATKNKDSKCSLVLTIAAQYGLVNQESFFNKSVASENLTGYYLLHKGEFAYNRSYSAGYDWGTVKRLDNYDQGVLSTLYICFKINETIVDSDYLAYYFESTKWHRGLSDIAGEGARNHGLLNVSITDYFNTKHRFPVIEEQKAIAKMLNTITEKERKATLLGECYQKQKQYLLRQMFI